jgi:hypothetical protein
MITYNIRSVKQMIGVGGMEFFPPVRHPGVVLAGIQHKQWEMRENRFLDAGQDPAGMTIMLSFLRNLTEDDDSFVKWISI